MSLSEKAPCNGGAVRSFVELLRGSIMKVLNYICIDLKLKLNSPFIPKELSLSPTALRCPPELFARPCPVLARQENTAEQWDLPPAPAAWSAWRSVGSFRPLPASASAASCAAASAAAEAWIEAS